MMKILFYLLPSGRNPVLDFITQLDHRSRAETFRVLELLEKEGLDTPQVSLRQIRGKLWEIRIRSGGEVRIFYVMKADEKSKQMVTMILLLAYAKKTRQAPQQEIDLAMKRLKEVLE